MWSNHKLATMGLLTSNPLRGSVAFLICSPSSSSTISIFFITSPSRSLDCSPPSLDCSPMLFSKQPWHCNWLLYDRFFFSWNFYHRCFVFLKLLWLMFAPPQATLTNTSAFYGRTTTYFFQVTSLSLPRVKWSSNSKYTYLAVSR